MRQLIILISISFSVTLYGQKATIFKDNNKDTANLVSFVVKFDKRAATKDGYHLGGYIASINYRIAKGLNGKTIKITGKVSIEKGIGGDVSDSFPIRQGRLKDTKHIESPIIEIVKK